MPPLRPAAAFFADELPDRLPPDDLFAEELLVRFALVFAAPFLPAALFFAEDDFAELRPPVLFLADEDLPELLPPPLLFLALDDEREPDEDPELFLAPPLDERDELDFLPPLLLLPDEREPDDFFVVAIRVFPPKKWYELAVQHLAKFVPTDSVLTQDISVTTTKSDLLCAARVNMNLSTSI